MKCFYALISNQSSVVLSVIQWDTTYPSAPKVSDGTLVRCHADVQAGQVFDKATGKFTFPTPVSADAAVAPAPASISEVAAELAQVEKSVQVLMSQK
jgi:hypothetical protein